MSFRKDDMVEGQQQEKKKEDSGEYELGERNLLSGYRRVYYLDNSLEDLWSGVGIVCGRRGSNT